MEALKPQLKHNRIESRRLSRRKWQAALLSVLAFLPLPFVLPEEFYGRMVIAWVAAMMTAVGFFEVKSVLLFRRDVRERKARGMPLGPLDEERD